MKVLQVIDTLHIGGAERIVVTMSNLLFDHKIDVSVLVLVNAGELSKELHPEIPFIQLERTKRFDQGKMKALAKMIAPYDIVHVHLKHSYRYVSIVAKLFKIKGPKIVFHDHSHTQGISKFSLKLLKDSLFRNVLKPKYYIGVSVDNIEWAKTALKLDSDNCFLLENIITKITVDPAEVVRKGIVMVGNIVPVKHIEFAIELAHKLEEPLTIYGKLTDDTYYQKLQDIIQAKAIKNIRFIHDEFQIQNQLYQYKYAIHTAHKETGPLVLIEYLAQGLPFLSYASGQVYHTLKHDLPEFFINTFTIEDWVKQIALIGSISEEKMHISYNQYFSETNYIQKCLSIYQRMLNS